MFNKNLILTILTRPEISRLSFTKLWCEKTIFPTAALVFVGVNTTNNVLLSIPLSDKIIDAEDERRSFENFNFF